jgi:uncharacterized Zn finger protein
MQTTLKCPHCGKYDLIKAGHQRRAGIGKVQQWACNSCGRTTTKPITLYRDDKGHFIPRQDTSTTPIL